jgi:hypothetical protein
VARVYARIGFRRIGTAASAKPPPEGSAQGGCPFLPCLTGRGRSTHARPRRPGPVPGTRGDMRTASRAATVNRPWAWKEPIESRESWRSGRPGGAWLGVLVESQVDVGARKPPIASACRGSRHPLVPGRHPASGPGS